MRKMPKNRKKETNITINLQSLIMERMFSFDTMTASCKRFIKSDHLYKLIIYKVAKK